MSSELSSPTPAPATVAIRTDGTSLIGLGHVMRCLTLANELAARGARVDFVLRAPTAALVTLVERHGHRVHTIARALPVDERSDPAPEMASWSSEEQELDAAATVTALRGLRYDLVVVDHYRLDARWERKARAWARRCLVIDDLANRPHDSDLLLDQTVGRAANDYRTLLPPASELRLGCGYALLRPEFAAARAQALPQRALRRASVARVLVSLGGTDPRAITAEALAVALGLPGQPAVDVVVGSGAPSLPALRQLASETPRVALHVDSQEMARLMSVADLAVGAAGTTSWERCCVGLPTVALILAANQRAVGEQLDALGAATCVHDLAALEAGLRALADDAEKRATMSERAAALVDGQGATRIADALALLP